MKVLILIAMLFIGNLTIYANGIEQQALETEFRKKEFETWAGVFKYKEYISVKTEGLQELFIVIYQNETRENLADFAVKRNQEIKYLFERREEKGAIPIFDGYEVFPNKGKAEIILRWRITGSGGIIVAQKFVFDGSKIILLDQASGSGKSIWKKSLEEAPSSQPKLAPSSQPGLE
jgi:hypothetical protein